MAVGTVGRLIVEAVVEDLDGRELAGMTRRGHLVQPFRDTSERYTIALTNLTRRYIAISPPRVWCGW